MAGEERTLDCTVLTPEGQIFHGPAQMLVAPGESGYLGVLFNHAPLISTLGRGTLKIKSHDGTTRKWQVEGGFLEVLRNKVSVLTMRA
ncbi:MAG: ATP synthase F1 subunit epsilon, partial [Planctomycetota bacterium]